MRYILCLCLMTGFGVCADEEESPGFIITIDPSPDDNDDAPPILLIKEEKKQGCPCADT